MDVAGFERRVNPLLIALKDALTNFDDSAASVAASNKIYAPLKPHFKRREISIKSADANAAASTHSDTTPPPPMGALQLKDVGGEQHALYMGGEPLTGKALYASWETRARFLQREANIHLAFGDAHVVHEELATQIVASEEYKLLDRANKELTRKLEAWGKLVKSSSSSAPVGERLA